MPRKKPLLINPLLNQFVYDTLVNSTAHERLKLNGKYLRAVKNSKTALTFVANSTDEEKAILLSRLGKQFAWVINIDKKKAQELMEQNLFGQSEVSDRALKEHFFVVSDKQVMQYISLMAANLHSETYLINRDFLKIGYRLKEWRKEYKNTTLNEIKEGSIVTKELARNHLYALFFSDRMEDVCGVARYSFLMLLYMFGRNKEFVPLSEIRSFFNGVQKQFKTVRGITQLLEVKFIEKNYMTKEVEYRVTSLGVEAVMKFQKRVFNAENF